MIDEDAVSAEQRDLALVARKLEVQVARVVRVAVRGQRHEAARRDEAQIRDTMAGWRALRRVGEVCPA
jgi:hypothetical protein